MGGIVGWLKALSIKGKLGLAIASLFVFTAAAPVPSENTADKVEQEQPIEQQEFQEQVEQAVVEVKDETEEEEIPFKTVTQKTDSLNLGVTQVQTQGKNGIRIITYKVTYEDGTEVRRVESSSEVTHEPVDKVVLEGTYVAPPPQQPQTRGSTSSNCDPNYSGGCVPIASDVDCAGGSGNGPAYVHGPVYVEGDDIYGLDGNNDGVGCES